MKLILEAMQWWGNLKSDVKLQTLLVCLLIASFFAGRHLILKDEAKNNEDRKHCREEIRQEKQKYNQLEKEFRDYIMRDINKTDSIQKRVDSLKA